MRDKNEGTRRGGGRGGKTTPVTTVCPEYRRGQHLLLAKVELEKLQKESVTRSHYQWTVGIIAPEHGFVAIPGSAQRGRFAHFKQPF